MDRLKYYSIIGAILGSVSIYSSAHAEDISNKMFKLSTIVSANGSCQILQDLKGKPILKWNAKKGIYSAFGVGQFCPKTYPDDETVRVQKMEAIALDGKYFAVVRSKNARTIVRLEAPGTYAYKSIKNK